MKISFNIKKSILTGIIIATLTGCNLNSDKKGISEETIQYKLKQDEIEKTNIKKEKTSTWESVEEYDQFVRSQVNENYNKNVQDIYQFYNIKRDIPKYGFKSKDIGIICFDCTGAVYKEKSDSIYFYSSCSEELFKRYMEYNENTKENLKTYLEDKINYYIKHEAAHAFYYELGKQLKEEYLFKIDYKNKDPLYNIKNSLIEEGVAEYISHKGELNESAKKRKDEDFKKMVQDKNDFYLYDLGFILVKPILDKNFEEGIKQLIKNPLNERDLNNLIEYQERILKKLE